MTFCLTGALFLSCALYLSVISQSCMFHFFPALFLSLPPPSYALCCTIPSSPACTFPNSSLLFLPLLCYPYLSPPFFLSGLLLSLSQSLLCLSTLQFSPLVSLFTLLASALSHTLSSSTFPLTFPPFVLHLLPFTDPHMSIVPLSHALPLLCVLLFLALLSLHSHFLALSFMFSPALVVFHLWRGFLVSCIYFSSCSFMLAVSGSCFPYFCHL